MSPAAQDLPYSTQSLTLSAFKTISAIAMSSASSTASGRSSHDSASTTPTSIHITRNPNPKFYDEGYPLVSSLGQVAADLPAEKQDHSAIHCARTMAQIHNLIIRAINSSYNHAGAIRASTQRCTDFLEYNRIIFNTLEHHHHLEESFFFPELEKTLQRPGAMDDNVKGHEVFMEQFHLFGDYVSNPTNVDTFEPSHFRRLTDAFMPDLVEHLNDEIYTLVNLHDADSVALRKVFDATDKIAVKDQDLYVDAPFILGCLDKSFTIDGALPDFPPIPWIAAALVRNWHARRHAAIWEFCPSDLKGNRRPFVQFLSPF